MRTLFGACILLGVGTALCQDELASRIDNTLWASSIVNTIFGTSSRFGCMVVASFFFSLLAHSVEACYTAYLCKTVLNMKHLTICKWFVLNTCTGFSIMKKVTELVDIDKAASAAEKSS